MRRVTGPIVLVLLAALAAAGCGDSGAKSAATTSTATAATTTPALVPPVRPAAPGSAEEAARRLQEAGYTVSKLAVNPPARAARRVGDQVLLYEYATPAAAKAGARVITTAIKDRPERGVVDTERRRVYFLGEQRAITPKERASFADLVDVGEGRSSP